MTVDTFTGTDGTDLSTYNASYVKSDIGSGTTTLIESNAVRHRGTVGGYAAVNRWYRNDLSIANVDIQWKWTVDNPFTEDYPQMYARGPSAWTGSTDSPSGAAAYSATGRPTLGDFNISLHDGAGSYITEKAAAFTWVNGHQVGAHFRVIGGLCWLTVWDITAGNSETSGMVHLAWCDMAATNLAAGRVMHAVTHGAASTTSDLTLDDFNPATATPAHPYPVRDRGTLANVAAGTDAVTLQFPATIATGNYLFMRVAVDNAGTNGANPSLTSITDVRNTWTVIGGGLANPGGANNGTKCYFAYAKVVTAYQAGDTLTPVYLSSPPAKAIVVEEWANVHATSPVAVATVNASGLATTAVSTGSTTPLAASQVVYAVTAAEAPNSETLTYDTDTTDGAWFELTSIGSTDATATNNQHVWGQAKVVTNTSAQTVDQVLGTARDWAGQVLVIAAATSTQNLSLAGPTVSITAGSVGVVAGLQLIAPTVQIFPGSLSLRMNVGLAAPSVAITPGTMALSSGVNLAAPTVAITPGTVAISGGAATLGLVAPMVTITAGTMSLLRAAMVFSPPTIPIQLAPPFERWHQERGQTVYRKDGVWFTVSEPWWNDIAVADISTFRPCGEKTDGTDRDRYLFIGGHEYQVADEIAAELQAAGYGAYLS